MINLYTWIFDLLKFFKKFIQRGFGSESQFGQNAIRKRICNCNYINLDFCK